MDEPLLTQSVHPSQSNQMNETNQMNQTNQMIPLPPEFLMPVPFCELVCDQVCWACGMCLSSITWIVILVQTACSGFPFNYRFPSLSTNPNWCGKKRDAGPRSQFKAKKLRTLCRANCIPAIQQCQHICIVHCGASRRSRIGQISKWAIPIKRTYTMLI